MSSEVSRVLSAEERKEKNNDTHGSVSHQGNRGVSAFLRWNFLTSQGTGLLGFAEQEECLEKCLLSFLTYGTEEEQQRRRTLGVSIGFTVNRS